MVLPTIEHRTFPAQNRPARGASARDHFVTLEAQDAAQG